LQKTLHLTEAEFRAQSTIIIRPKYKGSWKCFYTRRAEVCDKHLLSARCMQRQEKSWTTFH